MDPFIRNRTNILENQTPAFGFSLARVVLEASDAHQERKARRGVELL